MYKRSVTSKISYNSPFILTFAFVSLATLILGMITGGESTSLLFSVYRSSPFSLFFYIRLIGHVLGHTDFGHYFNNIMIILLIGPMLEEKYGSKNLLVMVLFTSLITGIFNIIFFSTALLGASGVVFMLIILASFVNSDKGRIPLTLILIILVFTGQEIYSWIFNKDNISYITHTIGGACGGAFGFWFNKGGYRYKKRLRQERKGTYENRN